MLNRIWFAFFVISALAASYQWLFLGNYQVFSDIVGSLFSMAELSVSLMILLFGTLTLWLGFLQIAQQAGLIDVLGRLLSPLFRRLMPEIPKNHPALGLITLNSAANILGLDNAATPIGLRAMRELQTLNKSSDTASNAQILFLVLNSSSLTILPVTIFMYRVQQGSLDPTAVFLPILLATSMSSIVGLISVALVQKIKLRDPVVLAWLGSAALILGGFMALLASLSMATMTMLSSLLGNITLFGIIVLFLCLGAYKKVAVYECFVEGAKDGFNVAKDLLPYLVAMLCAIGVLRSSGALDALLDVIRWIVALTGLDNRFVDALPTALMKPFSGSGARALMIETMQNFGVDSFQGLLAATIQGSTETTFYVLAVYFGAVGIKKARHAVPCALLADFAGVTTAIIVSYWFF